MGVKLSGFNEVMSLKGVDNTQNVINKFSKFLKNYRNHCIEFGSTDDVTDTHFYRIQKNESELIELVSELLEYKKFNWETATELMNNNVIVTHKDIGYIPISQFNGRYYVSFDLSEPFDGITEELKNSNEWQEWNKHSHNR